ncbi:MAG: triphosphoribosyl-dephospho-CoA synthase MdcB [Reyranella sp.]|nr:triphosphoribosyl-dephospho-CoA synthase MdcB [Reyranella sp.]
MIAVAAADDAVSADDLALAGVAVAAMHDELKVYPKPGLVSPVDSGAHDDMDFDLMRRSADSLLRPFACLAAAGRQACSFEGSLAPLGVDAEQQMLRATGGINTHRGAIFCMGLIVASIARTRCTAMPVSPAAIQAALMREWGNALEAHALRGDAASSHGALVRQTTGAGGARSEAARGFPGIFQVGVPAYRQAVASGLDANAASVHTLFALMEAVDDTTVLYRGGVDAGLFVRRSAAEFLAAGGRSREDWFERAERLHRVFVARNLSPGGCADLLAATLLVLRCSDRDPSPATQY